MKRVFVGLLVLFLCGFVFAESSEISTEFYIGVRDSGSDNLNDSSFSFWDSFGNYLIGLIIVLIGLIIVFKNKKFKKIVKKKFKKKKFKNK